MVIMRFQRLKLALAAWLAAWAILSTIYSTSPSRFPTQIPPVHEQQRALNVAKRSPDVETAGKIGAASSKPTMMTTVPPTTIETATTQLTVIIPCYEYHRKNLARLLASIFHYRRGTPCDFDVVGVHTIVSSVAEKAQFLSLINSTRWYHAGNDSHFSVSVHSLKETLLVAGRHGLPWKLSDQNIETWFRVKHTFGTRNRHWPMYKAGNISTNMSAGTNKHWLQSVKKMYGCAAFGGFGKRDQCFMLDADSHVKGASPARSGGVCEVVSSYVRHGRTVLVRPRDSFGEGNGFGKYSHVVELGRDLLSARRGRKLSGDAFGEFFALEIYHWIWSPRDVRDFLDDAMGGAMARLALSHPSKYSGWWHGGGPFVEELMYHFIYPRRTEAGYNYVSLVDFLSEQVSEATHRSMMERAGAFGSLGESLITIFSEVVKNDTEKNALKGVFDLALGIRMARCPRGAKFFLEYISVCTSE